MQFRVQFFRGRRDNIVSGEVEVSGAEVGDQVTAWLRQNPDGRVQLATRIGPAEWRPELPVHRTPAGRAPGAFGRQPNDGGSHEVD